MKIWTVPVAVVVFALAAPIAHADQCAWVDHAVAARAARAIARHPTVVAFCPLCGDRAPGIPHAVGDVSVQPASASLSQVRVDGRSVDLAYTYVKTSADRYANLAALSGCRTTGVPPSLRVDRVTSAGVLIRPSRASVRSAVAASPPAVHSAPAAPAPAVTSPPVIYQVSVAPAPPGWIFGLACCGGALAAGLILGLAGLAGSRRRRAALPRALALSDRMADRPAPSHSNTCSDQPTRRPPAS